MMAFVEGKGGGSLNKEFRFLVHGIEEGKGGEV